MNDTPAITGTAEDDDQLAAVARALAHPARVRIVRLLAEQSECRGAEVFAGLPLAQSTISEHLRVLREARLVSSRPCGTATIYCLSREVLARFADRLTAVAAEAPSCRRIEVEPE